MLGHTNVSSQTLVQKVGLQTNIALIDSLVSMNMLQIFKYVDNIKKVVKHFFTLLKKNQLRYALSLRRLSGYL